MVVRFVKREKREKKHNEGLDMRMKVFKGNTTSTTQTRVRYVDPTTKYNMDVS